MTANGFDFSRENSLACLQRLFRRSFGRGLHNGWFAEAWGRRRERWEGVLGTTLRAEVCVPAIQGPEMLAIYRDAYVRQVGLHLPLEVDAIAVDTQKIVPPGKKQAQKLTRYLVAQLQGSCPHFTADHCSALISKVQDAAKSANGAIMVLSANVLDVLLASDYCTGYSSCHRWSIGGRGEYFAGNWTYADSAEVLVAYLYEPALQPKIKQANPDLIEGLPVKRWRQFVFCPSQAKSVAYFSRNYPNVLPESQHTALRRQVAVCLHGAGKYPAAEGEFEVKWRWSKSAPVSCYPFDYGSYADSLSGAVVLAHEEAFPVVEAPDNKRPYCPCCGDQRDDSLFCCNSIPETRHCTDCGEDVEIEDRDDWDDWIHSGRNVICPSCADSWSFCSGCSEYTRDELMNIGSVRISPHRTRAGDFCQDCLDAFNIRECDDCGCWYCRTYRGNDEVCADCQSQRELTEQTLPAPDPLPGMAKGAPAECAGQRPLLQEQIVVDRIVEDLGL